MDKLTTEERKVLQRFEKLESEIMCTAFVFIVLFLISFWSAAGFVSLAVMLFAGGSVASVSAIRKANRMRDRRDAEDKVINTTKAIQTESE